MKIVYRKMIDLPESMAQLRAKIENKGVPKQAKAFYMEILKSGQKGASEAIKHFEKYDFLYPCSTDSVNFLTKKAELIIGKALGIEKGLKLMETAAWKVIENNKIFNLIDGVSKTIRQFNASLETLFILTLLRLNENMELRALRFFVYKYNLENLEDIYLLDADEPFVVLDIRKFVDILNKFSIGDYSVIRDRVALKHLGLK